jgi:hypothetical protein
VSRLTGRPPTRLSSRPSRSRRRWRSIGTLISAVRLAGDLNATVTDDASLDELMDKIKDGELRKLGPGSRRAQEPSAACPYPLVVQGLEPWTNGLRAAPGLALCRSRPCRPGRRSAPRDRLSRIAQPLGIEVRGNVADLRLTGGAVALPRLQAPVVAVVLGVRTAPASTTTGATSIEVPSAVETR